MDDNKFSSKERLSENLHNKNFSKNHQEIKNIQCRKSPAVLHFVIERGEEIKDEPDIDSLFSEDFFLYY